MLSTSAGLTLSVALGDPGRTVEAFEVLDYVEVGEIGQIPELGGQAAVKTFVPLGSRIANKRAGAHNYGSTTITVAAVSNDAGQQALSSGFDGANEQQMHAFRLQHSSIGNLYFTGVISGFRYVTGDANSIRQLSVTIAIVGKSISGAIAALLDAAGNELHGESGRLTIWV